MDHVGEVAAVDVKVVVEKGKEMIEEDLLIQKGEEDLKGMGIEIDQGKNQLQFGYLIKSLDYH